MRLRNKKTGEIVEAESCNSTTGAIGIYYEEKDGSVGTKDCFYSLAELCKEWEDYKPVEPLIKDEKIRKAVRAWAEACDVEKCHYDGDGDFATRWHGIKLDGSMEQLEEGTYTIAELCGEEEQTDDSST